MSRWRKGRFFVQEAVIRGTVFGAFAAAGGFLSSLFGGWDGALATLLIFMGVDYVTGLIVAGVFHKSEKTADGALESRAGWKGLCRKGMTLLVVLIGARLDLVLGVHMIRDAVVMAYVANETLSIVENAGLMGLPIPAVVKRAIEVLRGKSDVEPGVEKPANNGEKEEADDE